MSNDNDHAIHIQDNDTNILGAAAPRAGMTLCGARGSSIGYNTMVRWCRWTPFCPECVATFRERETTKELQA